MPKPNEVFVTVAIPKVLRSAIKDHAKKTDLKFKVVFRLALEEYVQRKAEEARQ